MKKMKRLMIWMAVWLMVCCVLPQNGAGFGESDSAEPDKKLHFELAVGVGDINPRAFFNRMTGITDLVRQYSGIYGGSFSTGGKFVEDKFFLPFRISALYDLTPKWRVRGGLEYGFASSASQKDFQLQLAGATDSQIYDVDYRISYLMPFAGVGYRISDRLEFGASLGLSLGSLSYNEAFTSSISGATESSSTWSFDATDMAPAAILACEYRIPLQKGMLDKMGFSVKLEMMLLHFGSFEGSKTVVYEGSGVTDKTEGGLYHVSWDPYGQGAFDYWDLFTAQPSGAPYSDVEKLGLNLSGIRLLIGFYF